MALPTIISNAGNVAVQVSASAATIYGYKITNLNSYPIYVKFYNNLAANVNPATDTPALTVTVAANSEATDTNSHAFGTALAVRVTARNVNSDHSQVAIPPVIELETAQSGGSGLLQLTEVSLTDSQIKTRNTDITIVPGQGANAVVVPVAAVLRSHIVTPYGNLDTGCNVHVWGGSTPNFEFSIIANNAAPAASSPTFLFTFAGDWITPLYPAIGYASSYDMSTLLVPPIALAGNLNNTILFNLENALGNLTGGDAANYLKISVWWLLYDAS